VHYILITDFDIASYIKTCIIPKHEKEL
jgi:hypothetical protein